MDRLLVSLTVLGNQLLIGRSVHFRCGHFIRRQELDSTLFDRQWNLKQHIGQKSSIKRSFVLQCLVFGPKDHTFGYFCSVCDSTVDQPMGRCHQSQRPNSVRVVRLRSDSHSLQPQSLDSHAFDCFGRRYRHPKSLACHSYRRLLRADPIKALVARSSSSGRIPTATASQTGPQEIPFQSIPFKRYLWQVTTHNCTLDPILMTSSVQSSNKSNDDRWSSPASARPYWQLHPNARRSRVRWVQQNACE